MYRLTITRQRAKCNLVLNSILRSVQISDPEHKSWVDEFARKTVPALLEQIVTLTDTKYDLICETESDNHGDGSDPDNTLEHNGEVV